VPGDLEKLPVSLQKSFARTEKATEGQQKLLLNLCVNYGSRGEIVRAARELAGQVKAGQIEPEQIDEAAFESCLYTAGVPDPDLLIRTSGELRISNFLLWQVAYTEFFFSDLYWPDFNRRELVRAILDYQGRERRYGGGSPVPADVCG